jgi:hypothetical protein
MTIANIATVFGPTLFGINTESQPGGGPVMVDTAMQNKVTLLEELKRQRADDVPCIGR